MALATQLETMVTGPAAHKPATLDAIREIEEELGFDLPVDYTAFLQRSNGFDIDVDPVVESRFRLHEIETIIDKSHGYGFDVRDQQIVVIGDDGGEHAYAIDFRFDPAQFVRGSYYDHDRQNFEYLGDSLEVFVRNVLEDTRPFVSKLVEQNVLTRWQAEELRQGRTRLRMGNYRLRTQLGSGGMGAVYEALDENNQTVALKVMFKTTEPELIARFHREASVAAKLNHPHLVTTNKLEQHESDMLLVMEYVPDKDLNEWLRVEGKLPVEWAVECVKQAALGLQHAHEKGIIHRDIKPGNILVVANNIRSRPLAKLLDLGLARSTLDLGTSFTNLTSTGEIMGTPHYMAPEQVRNAKAADGRADIFGLACTLFFVLTGELPYVGQTMQEQLIARIVNRPRRLREVNKQFPTELDDVLAVAMAHDPEERFPTPLAFAHAITPFTYSAWPT